MYSHDVIKTILQTEKSSAEEAKGKYFFQVASRANKIQIHIS